MGVEPPCQFIEQAPGVPHIRPHGPIASCDDDPAPFALTANTDSNLSSAWLSHDGQAGDCPSRVRYSNLRPQSRHAYSYSGMGLPWVLILF